MRGGRREVRGRRAYILRRQPEQGVHATTVGECGGLLHSVQRVSRARAACSLSGRDLELCWLLLLAHRGQNLVSKTRWRETPSHKRPYSPSPLRALGGIFNKTHLLSYSNKHFFVFLYLSVCEALKLRSLPFTHPIYVASRYFQ